MGEERNNTKKKEVRFFFCPTAATSWGLGGGDRGLISLTLQMPPSSVAVTAAAVAVAG